MDPETTRQPMGFTLPPEAPAPAGLVVTAPENLPPRDQIPYAKADRTPDGPLQLLEMFAAQWLGVDRDLLVSLEGRITERGGVVLFARNADPGDIDPIGYVVASYDADEDGAARLHVTERTGRTGGRLAYESRVEALS